MLAADVQKKLDKASVDTRNLSEELKNLKGNISNQQNTSKSDSEYHGNIEFPIKSEYVRSGLTFLSAFLISFLILFSVAENTDLIMLSSSLQSREKELQWQLNESNEKKQQQLVYITELETTLVDTDRILKKLSDDILKKEQEFKTCKGRQLALTIFL